MKRLSILLIALSLLLILSASIASADGPADYRAAMVKCSGLNVAQLAHAQQVFDTEYGWAHQLRTPEQWQGTYEARSNEFAQSLGCNSPLDSGKLTFWYRIYVPTYRHYLDLE